MLELKNIHKEYITGGLRQNALNNVSIRFRKNEFVAILGQSGSGKTTMLNIIGGLDRYNSGDLLIDGVSTKQYKDADWDFYRNNSIGFVFQSYNLIPHQNVQSNVELALTLAGISRKERKRRAKEMLEKVGLGDQLHKKPNQMSGGQMQRVAIARALVNDPEILLADEPTGALDSATSVQIMDLLKDIARDRLVIMVTHNPDLAEKYATRIVQLFDGDIVGDSDPWISNKEEKNRKFRGGVKLAKNDLPDKPVAEKEEKIKDKLESETDGSQIFEEKPVFKSGDGSQIFDAKSESKSGGAGQIFEEGSESKSGHASRISEEESCSEGGDGSQNFEKELDSKSGDESQISEERSESKSGDGSQNFEGGSGFKNGDESQISGEEPGLKNDEGSKPKPNPKMEKAEKTPDEFEAGSNQDETYKPVRKAKTHTGRVSMSMLTALSLSFQNLRTKKGRTIMTAFAGSIGIIGIALILSLSNGVQEYIDRTERDTLSAYPITIESETIDWMSMLLDGRAKNDDKVEHTLDKVYQRGSVVNTLKLTTMQTEENNLTEFKKYIEGDASKKFKEVTNAIKYGYRLNMLIYKSDVTDGIVKVNPSNLINRDGNMAASSMSMMRRSYSAWAKLMDNEELLSEQYELLAGSWPKSYDEAVVFVNQNNEIDDFALYALGIKDRSVYEEIADRIEQGEKVSVDDYESTSYTYDDILKLEYKVVPNCKLYEKADTIWIDKSEDEEYMKEVLASCPTIKIRGIVRPKSGAAESAIEAPVGYRAELTEYIINEVNNSDIAKAQKKHKDINVFTGKEFSNNSVNAAAFQKDMTQEEMDELVASYSEAENATYENNLGKIGIADLANPSKISLYPKSFESKDELSALIDDYNKKQKEDEQEENVISYTDVVGVIMSAVTDIVQMITYVLIAFVGISLVVSSIMIGIITYISVLERTKEIGVLRSIGASKKDISRVFNAETVIIGLAAGIIGIGATVLLNIPVNIIIEKIADVESLSALPLYGAVALVIISVVLTVIAGLIPSKVAANKDPVEALRAE